jgi:hypothetical protein
LVEIGFGALTFPKSNMAMNDHLLRFRSMSTEELQSKRTALEAQETFYSQQTIGTNSFVRDISRLQDQLNAIAYVLRERGSLAIVPPANNLHVGVADFSGIS